MTKKKDSFEEYLSAEYIGSSRAKRARVSGYNYISRKEKDTKYKQMGRAGHCAILEPESFKDRYTFLDRDSLPAPNRDFRYNPNKEYKDEFKEKVEAEGKEMLTEDQGERAFALRDRLHEVYGFIVRIIQNSEVETSYYVQDQETGLYIKARPDIIHEDRGLMFDVKTTSKSAKPGIWDRECKNYDYPYQTAYHMRVIEQVTGKSIDDAFYIVAETVPPYDIAVRHVPDEVLDIAKDRVEEDLQKIKRWTENDHFPGYEELADSDSGEFPISELMLDTYYFDN